MILGLQITAGVSATHQQGASNLTRFPETHVIPEGVRSDWIFSGQRAAAEDDEDQDQVGEDVMVDQSMASHADPSDREVT